MARARAGDRDALAEMYAEYAARVHDFCFSLLRDPDEAADAMQDTFVLAAQRIEQLRDPERLTAWLFAIARHVSFRRLDQRRRVTPTDAPPEIVLDDDAIAGVAQEEAAALVWAAASGLSERDQAVLTLNTRHGLEGADLAAAVGVVHANPYSLLHRAKIQLERAVGVLLVARNGATSCSTLEAILRDWNGELTPLLRKRVGRHVDECAACQHTRARVQPIAVLSAIPILRPKRAAAMSGDELMAVADSRPHSGEQWRRDGFPPAIDDGRGRRVAASVAGAATAGVVLLLLVGPAGDGGDSAASPAPVTDTPTRAARLTDVARSSRSTPEMPVTTSPAASPTTALAVAAPTPTAAEARPVAPIVGVAVPSTAVPTTVEPNPTVPAPKPTVPVQITTPPTSPPTTTALTLPPE